MSPVDHAGRSDTGTPARLPDQSGHIERDGVKVWWEAYGTGDPAILLLPAWSIGHSRIWKAQIAALARGHRVVTFDPRGNGGSDRPVGDAAYHDDEIVDDALAVLDAAGVDRVVAVGLSSGARYGIELAGRHPERVLGLVAIGSSIRLVSSPPSRERVPFDRTLPSYEGWDRMNRHSWLADWRGFLEFFFGQVFSEPHSLKQIEDGVAFGLETTPETILHTLAPVPYTDEEGAAELCRSVRCPVLVVHGERDQIVPPAIGARLAELTGTELVSMAGSGHSPQAREPVRINLLIRDFAARCNGGPQPAPRWTRAPSRVRRALIVTSPIGLGHAWRDVRIAQALRRRVPAIGIEWLAQDPVTRVLEAHGEAIHPASAELAPEAAHIDRESGDFELNAFQAMRRMDEILCANFMLFHDVVQDGRYDLWVGDEAWEVDYFLHENPELKTAAYAWMADFVGFVPLPAGGEREAAQAIDMNAQMIEHIARFGHVRDCSLFVGDPEDVIPGRFGPGLPEIRAWTREHYQFVGSITACDPEAPPDREAIRASLGWAPGERVCVVAVGGSAAGAPLLRRLVAAAPAARERVPGLRLVLVTGPRIDPDTLAAPPGVDVLGYVDRLDRVLAACDTAVVQGGLTTTMELVAAGVPFVSLPLRNHFEQRVHVRHRLDRYGATDWLEYADATPAVLADAIAGALARGPGYRLRPSDGADRAAAELAGLLG